MFFDSKACTGNGRNLDMYAVDTLLYKYRVINREIVIRTADRFEADLLFQEIKNEETGR